ncbi:MAG: DUF1572 family protein [Gemmatimonadales bacterium]|nr:DUF1572 family protein [Gemmatimonadales bacterium]
MSALSDSVTTIAKNRLVLELPAQIRECLGLLSDDQIWWRPNATSNSVGNLVIHLCGSTRHFLGRGVGGSGYVRDRDAEFAAKGPVPKAELMRMLDETAAETDRIIGGLDEKRLLENTQNIEATMTVISAIMRMSHHWAYHVGQIVFVTKSLREGSVQDLFRKTMVK